MQFKPTFMFNNTSCSRNMIKLWWIIKHLHYRRVKEKYYTGWGCAGIPTKKIWVRKSSFGGLGFFNTKEHFHAIPFGINYFEGMNDFKGLNSVLTFLLIMHGGEVFRTLSNFAASGNPLTFKYIEMLHGDFSYLSIY